MSLAPLLRFAPHLDVTETDPDPTASALYGLNRT